jgi:hypothetical protein
MAETICHAGGPGAPAHGCELRLVESGDGGRHWEPSPSEPTKASVGPGLAATGGEPALGQTWLVRVGRSAGYLTSVPTKTSPGAASSAPLWYTANRGASWSQRRISCGALPALSVALSAPTSRVLFAVCAGQGGARSQLKSSAVSTNAGRSWTVHVPCPRPACWDGPLDQGYLGQVDAVTSHTAFVIGGRSALLVTRDGGVSWQSQTRIGNGAGDPEQVTFLDDENGLVIAQPSTGTDATLIWHTSNAGKTWTPVIPTTRFTPPLHKPPRARHSHGAQNA